MKRAELLKILKEKINQLESITFYDDNLNSKKLLQGVSYVKNELLLLDDNDEFEILSKEQFDLISKCSNYSKREDIKKLPNVMQTLCSNICDFDLFYNNDNVVKMAVVSLYDCPMTYIFYFKGINFKNNNEGYIN